MPLWPLHPTPHARPTAGRLAKGALAVAVGTTLVLGTALPYATLLRPATYDRTWRWDPAQRLLAAIPEGATVESDLTLLAYLVPNATVYWSGIPVAPADWVVVDAFSPAWGGNPPLDAARWAGERWGIEYELVLDDGAFQLARRVD